VLEATGSYPVKQIRSVKNSRKPHMIEQNKFPQSSSVESTHTRGGRHSSAWRRSTEKPPCVLVSEAVSVLQNDRTTGLAGVLPVVELDLSTAVSFC
jgi:hypothetical protein